MLFEPEAGLEKRRFVRVQFREPVQFYRPARSSAGGCLSCDISLGGLRIKLEDFVPINTELRLEIPLLGEGSDEQVVALTSRVVWMQRVRYSDQYMAGLEFNNNQGQLQVKEKISQFIHSKVGPISREST